MTKFALAGLLCLLGVSSGRAETLCICVDPVDCVNGVADTNADGRIIDYTVERCSGLRRCCQLSDRRGQPTTTSSSPTHQPASSDRNKAGCPPAADAPIPPEKVARLSGCGVRRNKGVPTYGNQADERADDPGCGMGLGQPKVGIHLHKVSADNEDEQVDTFYGELPWMVRVMVNRKFECGGSLVSPHVVLTAAHCVKDKQAEDLSVEAGEWDTSSTNEPEAPQKREIITVAQHKNFNSENGQHDIALLFTKKPFVYSPTVDHICIGEKFKNLNQGDCYLAGWGKSKESDPKFSPILRKIPIPVMNNSHCEKVLRKTELGPQFALLPGFVCVGGVDNRDTCKGDGGGPLFCTVRGDPDRFAVVGIISWGLECATGSPTVVAAVPYYRSWIDEQLGKWMNDVFPKLGSGRPHLY